MCLKRDWKLIFSIFIINSYSFFFSFFLSHNFQSSYFVIVDMYIFIVIVFLWTPLIENQILRYVVYKPHLLLLLLQ